MPNYQWKCKACNDIVELVVPSDERDTYQFKCEECGSTRKRLFGMPMVMKASYPDGTKREGFADMKATARLEEAKAKLDWRSDDARQINKELDDREKKARKAP